MDRTKRLERLTPVLLLAIVAAIVLPGLSAFGVWDPWELTIADAARHLVEGDGQADANGQAWIASAGMRAMGVGEGAARLPVALSALALVVLLIVAGGRLAGPRTGVYAAAVVASTPLFMLNARPIFGSAPAFLLHAITGLSLAMSLLRPDTGARQRIAWLALAVAAGGLGTLDAGVLRAVLPPLLATVATLGLHGLLASSEDPAQRVQRWLGRALIVASLVAVGGVGMAVAADLPGPSTWLGGTPRTLVSPPFESLLQRLFHSFAPWSALLPLSLSAMMWPDMDPKRRLLCLWLTVWAATGYAAHTLFVSRYAETDTFLPIAALALLVAVLLRELEDRPEPHWAAAWGAVLLCALLIRDFAVSPNSAVDGLGLAGLDVKDAFHPKAIWAALIGGFGLLLLLTLGGGPPKLPTPSGMWNALRGQWHSSRGAKVWLSLLALLLTALIIGGALAWLMPKRLHLTTLATKWARRAGLVPVAIAMAVALVPLVRHFYARLGRLRLWPLLACGMLLGGYTAQGFLPKLSAHYSPRSVYETYNRLATSGEPLAQFKITGRAATYYAKGEIVDVSTLSKLLNHLKGDTRRWAVLPADELPRLDRMLRRRTGQHAFVADGSSDKVVLIASKPIAGHKNQNYLVNSVVDEPPKKIQHPLKIEFDDKIRLLGYDLKLPHKGHVGAGEDFHITWYFEALKPIPGSYRVFVHIDGPDRVHADHDPVGGKYPVRLWDKGDFVIDRHKVKVSATTKPGKYTIHVGFYSGGKRLKVKLGPKDSANRAKAGVLRIH